ncbi:hypothetical protein BSKO_06463 [Bryopsis sp. KO-2023]|nr:hypothetical protein BSKO_06463 [Bryopsis sp. KO-2023]
MPQGIFIDAHAQALSAGRAKSHPLASRATTSKPTTSRRPLGPPVVPEPPQFSLSAFDPRIEAILDGGAGKRTPEKKPLKINTDLLLYRSRQKRIHSQRMYEPDKKKKALVASEEGFKKVLRSDPSEGRAYVSLGRLYVSQKRFNEARKLYEDGCAATQGNNAYIWTAWGNLESKQGNPPKARRLFDAAVVADRSHMAAWHCWGMLEEREGHYEKAKNCWIKGIKYGKHAKKAVSPYLYNSLGNLACKLGLLEEARSWFREGTNTTQESYALWNSWARLEAEVGDPKEAPRLFEQALKVNRRCRYTHLTWAMLEKSQGRIERARELLERGHLLNYTEPAILQAWAVLECEEGNIDKARELFQKGTELDGDYQHLWQAWGVMEFRAGNITRARELFQEGVWAKPSHRNAAYIFQAWAVLEASDRNVPLARELYKCGVKVDPKNQMIWDSWIALEESVMALERANELRNIAMQQRTEPVFPDSFTMLASEEASVESFLEKLSDWFTDFKSKSRENLIKQRSQLGGGET